MTDEHDITSQLARYADALENQVEPTSAREIMMAAAHETTLETTHEPNHVTDNVTDHDETSHEPHHAADHDETSHEPNHTTDHDETSHESKLQNNRHRSIATRVLVAAAAAAVMIVGVGALWVASDNRDTNNEVAATGDAADKITPGDDPTIEPPTTPNDTSQPNNSSNSQSANTNAALTNAVPVIVRGTLMVDPRGHSEICTGATDERNACAGIPLVGADIAEDWATLQAGQTPTGDQIFLMATGQLGEEGLWVNSYEEVQQPTQRDPSGLNDTTNCRSQECHDAIQNRIAVFTDTLNSMVATDPNLAITHLVFHMQPVEQDAQATAIRALIHVPMLDDSTRQRLENLGSLTNDTLSHFDIELFAGIELTHGASIPDLPTLYPSQAPILTESGPSFGSMMALLTGTLTFDESTGCSIITPNQDANNGPGVHVMWPYGYTASATDQTILNFDGVVVARAGDTVSLGGGHIPYAVPADYQSSCGTINDVFLTSGLGSR